MTVLKEMGAAMAESMKVIGAVATAQASAGISDADMKGIKDKLQNKQVLSAGERAQIRALGAAIEPELAKIEPELTDIGRGMATGLRQQFAAMLELAKE